MVIVENRPVEQESKSSKSAVLKLNTVGRKCFSNYSLWWCNVCDIQISLKGSYSSWLSCSYYGNSRFVFFEFSRQLWCKGMLLVLLGVFLRCHSRQWEHLNAWGLCNCLCVCLSVCSSVAKMRTKTWFTQKKLSDLEVWFLLTTYRKSKYENFHKFKVTMPAISKIIFWP